jgi:hypothetical protein
MTDPFEAAREGAAKATEAPGVRARVILTEGRSLREAPERGAPAPDDVTTRALARLTPQLRKALIAAEPEVLAWLRTSQENRVQFTLDPVGALQKIVPSFDAKLISELGALRSASSRVAVDVPGVKLESFQLEVEEKPADPKAGPKEQAR